MKHFKLTDEIIYHNRIKLYRIEATEDLPYHNIKRGDKGGFVQSKENLDSDAWIFDNAKAYGESIVCGEAQLYDNVEVCGKSRIYGRACLHNNVKVEDEARIYEYAKLWDSVKVFNAAEVFGYSKIHHFVTIGGYSKIYGNSRIQNFVNISDKAHVFGDTQIYDSVKIWDKVTIYDKTILCDSVMVYGDSIIKNTAKIGGNARICNCTIINENDYCVFHNFYHSSDTITFIKKYRSLYVICSGYLAFEGELDGFREKIQLEFESKNKRLYKEFLSLIETAKLKFDLPYA